MSEVVKIGIIADVHNGPLELTVTGTATPDCTGTYVEGGIYADKPVYIREGGGYEVWWKNDILQWYISTGRGGYFDAWRSANHNLSGEYIPVGTYTGNPVVAASEPVAFPWDGDQRWYSNAPVRMANFAGEMETQSADLVVDFGDIVNGTGGDATELAEIVAALEDNYSGERYYIVGNHEITLWNADWTDYEAEISQTPTGLVSSWSTGKPAGWPVTTAYSFDSGGIHFVIMALSALWSPEEKAALNTWLDTDLDATSLPIVVLTHHHLDDASGLGWGATYDDCETIQATLANYNVQAVFGAHMHQVPRLADFITYPIGADVPFYHLRANCIGPMNASTPDTDVGKDAAFYLFEIIPDAVAGTSHARANIKVTCYYTAREPSNQVDSMDREYIQYAIF